MHSGGAAAGAVSVHRLLGRPWVPLACVCVCVSVFLKVLGCVAL